MLVAQTDDLKHQREAFIEYLFALTIEILSQERNR